MLIHNHLIENSYTLELATLDCMLSCSSSLMWTVPEFLVSKALAILVSAGLATLSLPSDRDFDPSGIVVYLLGIRLSGSSLFSAYDPESSIPRSHDI